MKNFTKQFSISLLLISLLIAFSSFSIPSTDKEAILRNVEVLSQGEESTRPECVVGEGRCIDDNGVHLGMRIIL